MAGFSCRKELRMENAQTADSSQRSCLDGRECCVPALPAAWNGIQIAV